jgi:hypothetical protein
MPPRWSVQSAKAKLSEVLARARAGEPQRIGLDDSCIVVSEQAWASRAGGSLGAWLVDNAPKGKPLAAPSRKSKRGDPFAPMKKKPRRKRTKR